MNDRVPYFCYDDEGVIRKFGFCQTKDLELQGKRHGWHVEEGIAHDSKQKMKDGKLVNKTPEEIEADRPPRGKIEDEMMFISKKDWQELNTRLNNLEDKVE